MSQAEATTLRDTLLSMLRGDQVASGTYSRNLPAFLQATTGYTVPWVRYAAAWLEIYAYNESQARKMADWFRDQGFDTVRVTHEGRRGDEWCAVRVCML